MIQVFHDSLKLHRNAGSHFHIGRHTMCQTGVFWTWEKISFDVGKLETGLGAHV